MGICINSATNSTLLCYSDSDWEGCQETRRSTGGFCTYVASNVISWSAKRHERDVTEVVWLQNLLKWRPQKWCGYIKIMGLRQKATPLMLCNLSAVCFTANPMFHKRAKHFDVDYHYVRQRVALKALEVKHISAALQIADIFTKSLPHVSFFRVRSKLGVSVSSTPSLRGCNSRNVIETPGGTEDLKNVKAQTQAHKLQAKPTNEALAVKLLQVLFSQKNNPRQCRASCVMTPGRSTFSSNRFSCLDLSPNMC